MSSLLADLDPKIGLIAATVVALGATYLLATSRKSNKPPIVPYVVPWLGSAITMGKDPDGFFKRVVSVFSRPIAVPGTDEVNLQRKAR